MFILHDKKLNEIVGIFETYNDALAFYMDNNFMERLKLYRHHIMNSEILEDNVILLRICEEIMEQTYENLNSGNINYTDLQLKLDWGKSLLSNFKLPITMNIIYFDNDTKRKVNLKY
jgi:hypothetical protein